MLTLKEWRRARGIAVVKMSEILGIHPNTYIKWENNPSKIGIENAHKIADVLAVNIEDIDFSCPETLQKCGEDVENV